ncbi:hypothetical protein BV25DRAFT_782552 [Artomyces pyxidatus]|uniref:Uncharacterized protein n=1 Tax=Artomyces pyxidatus TaxID=48021 RepID=A0ACB8SY24_9AGAM|nr:hypothetical protein BV25DRAFT_782552 [Artomyces pyxidatus]
MDLAVDSKTPRHHPATRITFSGSWPGTTSRPPVHLCNTSYWKSTVILVWIRWSDFCVCHLMGESLVGLRPDGRSCGFVRDQMDLDWRLLFRRVACATLFLSTPLSTFWVLCYARRHLHSAEQRPRRHSRYIWRLYSRNSHCVDMAMLTTLDECSINMSFYIHRRRCPRRPSAHRMDDVTDSSFIFTLAFGCRHGPPLHLSDVGNNSSCGPNTSGLVELG